MKERYAPPEIKEHISAAQLHDILKNNVGIGAQTVALNKLLEAQYDTE